MIDIKNIIQGWTNVLIEDSEIEQIAKYRLSICNGCEHKIEMIGVECCGICHCPLIAKTRSNSKCDLNKW